VERDSFADAETYFQTMRIVDLILPSLRIPVRSDASGIAAHRHSTGRKRMTNRRVIAGLMLGTMLAAPAAAQDNMDKLTNMQRTDATFTFIDQEGQRADAPAEDEKCCGPRHSLAGL
jgi:hypothetical protein